jgi:hypothetical protein
MPYIQKFRCPVIFSAYIEESYTRVRERMNATVGVSASHLLPTLYMTNTSPPSTPITNQEWEDIEREAGSDEGMWRGCRCLEYGWGRAQMK